MNAAVVLLAAELAAGAHARFESRYLRRTDAAPAPYDDQVLGGLGIRGNVGHEVVQYAIGLDFFGGATHPAAFAYAVHLRPIGVAFVDGAGFRLSSTLGIGFDGATALLDPATRMPLDVWLEVPIAEGVKI